MLTVTTPPAQGHSQGPTTTFTYDTDGRLTQVSGPVPGANASFTYDAYGRKRTSTDATGLTLTYDYDALDRVTRVTYPDTTYEETVYKWLDAGEAPGPPWAVDADLLRRAAAAAGDARRGRADDAVPVRRLRMHLVHGWGRPAHEAHRPQRQRDDLGLRPAGTSHAGDASRRQQRELHVRGDVEPAQAEDRPQGRHDDLRVLPGRQAEAEELLGRDACRELHVRPRRRSDADGSQRHGHPDLDLRHPGPRRDRGQRKERLDGGLHVRRRGEPGHCCHSTGRRT